MHHFAMPLAADRRDQLLAEARASVLAAQGPTTRRRQSATRRVRSAWTAALDATTRPYLRGTA